MQTNQGMNYFSLHVDLKGSRDITAKLDDRDRRRFASCCLKVLELLAQRFLEEQGAKIWWAGDGGICLVPYASEPEAQLERLLEIAEAYPTYVTLSARPPVMRVPAPWPLHFRRGISVATDIPDAVQLDLRAIGSFQLANAIKFERRWIHADVSLITLWADIAEMVKEPTWQKSGPVETGLAVPSSVVYFSRESAEVVGSPIVSQSLSRMRALENCTIHALNNALSEDHSASHALRQVFEPRNYMGETLIAMHEFLKTVLVPADVHLRVALFLPTGQTLRLVASSGKPLHRSNRDVGMDTPSTVSQAFGTRKPIVIPDTRAPPEEAKFCFFGKEQEKYLRSIVCIPVLESRLEKKRGERLPAPTEEGWGETMGVVCVDADVHNAFSSLAVDGGRALLTALDALIRDVEIGILLSRLQGWSD